MIARCVLIASTILFTACLVACSGAGRPGSPDPTSAKVEPAQKTVPTSLDPVARKKRGDAWMEDQSAKADALAAKAEALQKRLAEREATYKRRTADGVLDAGTRDEIARLKKELDQLFDEQVYTDEQLAAGPPESVLAGEAQPEPVASSEPTASPKKNPTPKTTSTPTASSSLEGFPGSVGGPAKTVHVSGYTRRDGTYVPPHVRSAPRR